MLNVMLTPYMRYFDFQGRSSRKEFWMFMLFYVIASMCLSAVDSFVFGRNILGMPSTPLTSLFGLVSLIPSLAVGVRRMHDLGKSGWNVLWALLPIVGWIIYLIMLCRPGVSGPNTYGADPLGASGAQGAAA